MKFGETPPGITSAEGLELPKFIDKDNDLKIAKERLMEKQKRGEKMSEEEVAELATLTKHDLTSAEGLKLPDNIAGDLDLRNPTSAEGLKLPDKKE